MSAHVSEQSFQYVGILNGVMYRIDPATGRSMEPMFGTQPFKTWSGTETSAQIGTALANMGADAAPVAVAEAVVIERVAAVPSTLFPRSGAEPLRAGHPDLWALLVAGTSLEGSTYTAL